MRIASTILPLLAIVIGVQSAALSFGLRSHNNGPGWLDHCWDHHARMNDPFCISLTSSTSTTTMRPTTTARTCDYEVHNDSSITVTDLPSGVQSAIVTQGTIGSWVRISDNPDPDYCRTVCLRSTVHVVECWAIAYTNFNGSSSCFLYYNTRPLYVIHSELLGTDVNGTTLYLKRCSDDPFPTAPVKTTTSVHTTHAPVTQVNVTVTSKLTRITSVQQTSTTPMSVTVTSTASPDTTSAPSAVTGGSMSTETPTATATAAGANPGPVG